MATADASYTRATELSHGKVRIASTETGWDDPASTIPPTQDQVLSSDDIGTAILTLIGDGSATAESRVGMPSHTASNDLRFEVTAPGFSPQPETTPLLRPASTTNNDEAIATAPIRPTSSMNNDEAISAIPATKVIIGGYTLTPGGATATGEGGAIKLNLDASGVPVLVVGGSTSTGQLSAVPSQVFTIGDFTGTAEATDYQFMNGDSTLGIGQSVTVSDRVIALTTDAAGSTYPFAYPTSASQAPGFKPTVVNGKTGFIISSQTLAPGNPITIDGTTISMTTAASATLVIAGDRTITLGEPGTDDFTATTGVASAPPGTLSSGSRESGGAAATTSSKTAGVGRMTGPDVVALAAFTLFFAVFSLD
jgi:hypothetical protein